MNQPQEEHVVLELKFYCAKCGQRLKADATLAGRKVVCPQCEQKLRVPEQSGSSDGQSAAHGSTVVPEPYFEPGKNYEDWALPVTLRNRGVLSEKGSSAAEESGDESGRATSGTKYEVKERLDEGGMGAVYQVFDRNISRDVAMKVALPAKEGSDIHVRRLIEEARITGQLEHPAVMPVHDLNVDARGNVYYTMKYLQGRTLEDILSHIRNRHPATILDYPLGRLLNIFLKVCDAVGYAHSRGVIHRDLKPEHIMVGEYGEVVVMDWGISKVLSTANQNQHLQHDQRTTFFGADAAQQAVKSLRETEEGAALTMQGHVVGTPAFMAPEQAAGRSDLLGPETDIYGLGAILYSILTLQWPVNGQTPRHVLTKVLQGDIPPPTTCTCPDASVSNRAPGDDPQVNTPPGGQRGAGGGFPHCPGGRIPSSLSAVAMKALSRNPVDRYAEVSVLQHDVEAWQAGYATTAENAGTGKQLLLFMRRNRGVSTAAVIIVLLILLGAGISTRFWIAAERSRQTAVEQKNRAQNALAELKSTAPAVAGQAREALRTGRGQESLKHISLAAKLVPSNVSYRIRKGHLLQARLEWERAAEAYTAALRIDPDNPVAEKNLQVCRNLLNAREMHNGTTAGDLTSLFSVLREQKRYMHAMLAIKQAHRVKNDIPRSYWETLLKRHNFQYKSMRTDSDGILRMLELTGTDVSDLSPLRGIPLESLKLNNTDVRDLSPLRNMPLRYLHLSRTKVNVLTSLKDLPLGYLDVSFTNVSDLHPLRGMPLKHLNLCQAEHVKNLEPLLEIPTLEELCVPPNSKNLEIVKRLPNLKVLAMDRWAFKAGQSPEEFWEKYEETKGGL